MSNEIYYTPFVIHSRAEHDDPEDMRRKYLGVVSSTTPDTRFTVMDISSLRNFARKANTGDGVPIFSDHRYYSEYPIGRSTKGWIKNNKEFWAEFFIRKGLIDSHSGTDTDDICTRIDERIITDLSKGFTGGEWYCTDCGEQFRGSYWKEDANGHVFGQMITRKGKNIRIMALVKNAELHHFSPVGSGSNQDAKIKEQLRSQLNNRSDAEQILQAICETRNMSFLEVRSEVLKPTTFTRSLKKMSTEPEKVEDRTGDLEHMALQDLQEEVTNLRNENKELTDKLALGDHEDFAEEVADLKKDLREAQTELRDNKVLAEQGKISLDIARREAEDAYIDYQGGRIKGEDDPKLAEVRTEIDRCMSINTLNETRNTYRRLARQERMGGRKSSDREGPVTGKRTGSVPPSDYALNITGV